MISRLLKTFDDSLTRYYMRLNKEHYRVVSLYNDGGLTRDITNKELFKIYFKMKICMKISSVIVSYRIKAQGFILSR